MNATFWASQFRDKTHETPRPNRTQARWENAQPRELAEAEAGWDEAKRVDDKLMQLRLEAVARQANEEATRRAKQREFEATQRAAADEKILAPAWQRFRASGGTAAEFEAIKPQILAQARMNAALDVANQVATNADADARRGFARLYQG